MFGQSLLSAFGSAACTTDTDQLFATDVQTISTATYQFNNATTSIPSNTYPGVASNITYAAGKFGNAAVFNGSSSFVTLPDSSSISQQNNFSLSFWIKPSGFVAYGTLINLYSDYRNIVEIRTSGIIGFNATGSWVNSPSSSITDGVWQHIAITKSSTAGTVIYVNGSSVVTDASNTGNASDFTASSYPNTLGAFRLTGSASYFFPGSIDQFRIFSSVLSQAAVTALYSETTTTATYPYVEYEGANPNSIAYYKMSDATDQLGNYNGTATNVNFNTEGKFGFAGAFNGSSSKVVLPDAVSSSIATASAFTISMWFNISGGSGRRFLYFFGRSTYIYLEVESDNTLRAVVNASGGSVAIDDSTVLSNNVWYNAILTGSNAANLTLYLNGSSVGTASWDGTFGAASGVAVNIGNENNALYFNGSIDQVRIYNAAVSAANVTALYNEIECPAVAVTNAFNTVLYTGNGSTQSVTGVGFKPDFSWTKSRTVSNRHQLFDSVRGATKAIESDTTFVESTEPTALTAFATDGFSLGTSGNVNSAGVDFVSWNWKAGGTAVSNTDGTITSQVSANVDAGFSIVSYAGGGSSGSTVGTGLNQSTDMIFVKNLSAGTDNWIVWHKDLEQNSTSTNTITLKGGNVLLLNTTNGTVSYGYDGQMGATSGENLIAYCFASIPGYSRVGSYIGGGATNVTVNVGFAPSFIMIKSTSAGRNWLIYDNVRETGTVPYENDTVLFPDSSSLEVTGNTIRGIQFTSTGFVLNQNYGNNNGSGETHIFLAIA